MTLIQLIEKRIEELKEQLSKNTHPEPYKLQVQILEQQRLLANLKKK